MTNNYNTQNAARMLRTHDLVSGEELLMVYYPGPGEVSINGYSVTRSLGRGGAEQVVFYRAFSNKLFTVMAESLSELYF
jgi:hypothetical protein